MLSLLRVSKWYVWYVWYVWHVFVKVVCVHGVYGGREGEGDVCMHTCTRIYAYMHLCVYVCMHLSIVQPVAYRVRLTEYVTLYDDVT